MLFCNHWRIVIEMDYSLKDENIKKLGNLHKVAISHAFSLSFSFSKYVSFILLQFQFMFQKFKYRHLFDCTISNSIKALFQGVWPYILMNDILWSLGTTLQLRILYTMSYFDPNFKSNMAVPHWGSCSYIFSQPTFGNRWLFVF